MYPHKFISRIVPPRIIPPRILRPKIIQPFRSLFRRVRRVRRGLVQPPSLIAQYFRAAQRFMTLDRLLFSDSFTFCQNMLKMLLALPPKQNCTTPLPASEILRDSQPAQPPILQYLMPQLPATSAP